MTRFGETAAELVAAIGNELAAELRAAVFVVVDIADESALLQLDYDVLLAGQHAYGWGYLLGSQARDLVVVGRAGADSWWRAKLHADAPDVRLWALRDVESPATALGLGIPRALDPATFDRLRATWDRIVIEGARREDFTLLKPPASARHARTRIRHV